MVCFSRETELISMDTLVLCFLFLTPDIELLEPNFVAQSGTVLVSNSTLSGYASAVFAYGAVPQTQSVVLVKFDGTLCSNNQFDVLAPPPIPSVLKNLQALSVLSLLFFPLQHVYDDRWFVNCCF